MADNAELATALAALAAAITTLNANNTAGAAGAGAARTVVLDSFESNKPFDLSTRTGSQAFVTACAALDDPWNRTVETFPSFIISLCIQSGKVKWNATAPTGILEINAHNLLTDYHSITDTDVDNARIARIDLQAIQNSRAMYNCIKSSITGDLRATIFDQADNLPTTEDVPTLF
jgi:hypothetical protein